MGILNIRPVKREGSRLVIGIAGISGSGKTRTAIELAYGLADFDASKVGFLDTENRRGSLYADVLKGQNNEVQPFLIADLDAPFSPARFKAAILEFQSAGVKVLVIDSISHEWEGQGGCHEIASPPGTNLKIKKWNVAKEEHKAMMNTLLQCDMHIIACLRARQKVKLEKNKDGKVDYVQLGVLPIQEENFMYEMTASMMMWNQGKNQEPMKCPGELQQILGRGKGYITSKDGKAILDWVDGAAAVNPDIERARNLLRTSTQDGVQAVTRAWNNLSEAMREAIRENGKMPRDIYAAAKAFDDQRAQASQGQDDELNDLNDRFANAPDEEIMA